MSSVLNTMALDIDCCYAKCVVMLHVVMLNVVMLNVIMLNVVMLSVVVPGRLLTLPENFRLE
jgi:hypothetical protein